MAACSGDDGGITVIDAGSDGTTPVDGGMACNPLSPAGAQGCPTGEKCTWITIQETPEMPADIGKLGCVMDGTVPEGQACTRGAPGETTGYDDCAAGAYCIDGLCRDICGFDNSANAACAAGFNCTSYANTFANGEDDPVAGLCKAACDPLTQIVTGGGMCPTGEGCYAIAGQTTSYAVCAAARPAMTHGMPITGPLFANSCAPGHTYRRTAQGATTLECTALCRPADVTSTTNMTAEGGVDPFTCESKGASPPDSATAGEYCQFWWARESFNDLSPFSNTLGHCFKHAIYQYDTNGDMMPDTAWPRCITLTTGDVLPPFGTPAMPDNDALNFACISYPVGPLQGIQSLRNVQRDGLPRADRMAPPRH